ncbi:hypothetical protein J3R83DRAFT_13428 [Lanmaoa asiatica]|nr:hypothetical protein J3R83DRAFT_13428 [Lanmaoa asiatica]
MSAVESVSGSEAKAKDEDIIAKGRSEMEQGIAQIKGVAAPGSTTAVPASQAVEAKAGDKPQQQPPKQEVSGPTPAPPPARLTQYPVRTDDPQSLQAEAKASGQELTGQTGTENVPQGGQGAQTAFTLLPRGFHTYLRFFHKLHRV